MSFDKSKSQIRIQKKGLPDSFNEHISNLIGLIKKEVKQPPITDRDKVEEKIRILIRRFSGNIIGYKPITFVILN